jgi:hypothetical protein
MPSFIEILLINCRYRATITIIDRSLIVLSSYRLIVLSSYRSPRWWIYGHTHYTTQFSKSNVRLVSNQRGNVAPSHSKVDPAPTSAFWRSLLQTLAHHLGREKNPFNAGKVIVV